MIPTAQFIHPLQSFQMELLKSTHTGPSHRSLQVTTKIRPKIWELSITTPIASMFSILHHHQLPFISGRWKRPRKRGV
jgi:hypothetical protein